MYSPRHGVVEPVARHGAADHAAGAALRLEDLGREAHPRERERGRDPGRPRADDRDLHAVRRACDLRPRDAVLEREALDLADPERRVVEVPHAALGARVVADAPGDARERVRPADDLDRLVVPPVRDEPEVVRDVLVRRAGLDARGRNAVEGAERPGPLECERPLPARVAAALPAEDDPLRVPREVPAPPAAARGLLCDGPGRKDGYLGCDHPSNEL